MKLLHESIYQKVLDQLLEAYKQVKIGDPLEKGTLLGPLHTPTSRQNFEKGIEFIMSQACSLVPQILWSSFNINIHMLISKRVDFIQDNKKAKEKKKVFYARAKRLSL